MSFFFPWTLSSIAAKCVYNFLIYLWLCFSSPWSRNRTPISNAHQPSLPEGTCHPSPCVRRCLNPRYFQTMLSSTPCVAVPEEGCTLLSTSTTSSHLLSVCVGKVELFWDFGHVLCPSWPGVVERKEEEKEEEPIPHRAAGLVFPSELGSARSGF